MIKGVIFDMDGLMIDTEKLLTRFWCEAANLYGFNMTMEHVLGIRSLAAKFAEPKLKGIFGESFDYMAVRAKRIELMNDYIEKNGIEKKKGLDDLLEYLKQNGYSIAVATATDLKRTTAYLTRINIFHYFDKIVCASMVKSGKPEPDIYLKASEELGFLPSECIALEDSPNGIISAHRAGCKPIMIPDLSEPDEELLKICEARLDSLDLVIDYLKSNR
ncbi:MAG: HAD family phosphatase [Oscillospiraceae bacterium]|nr:HAD family phosphatase [Oscillospiraceae bacterium]MBQ8884343.1 HAD family phosphatase [Oscillospiraceae bacterium]